MIQGLSRSLLGQYWTNLSSYLVIEVCFGPCLADGGITRYIYPFRHSNVFSPATLKVSVRLLFRVLLLLAAHLPSPTELEPTRERTQQEPLRVVQSALTWSYQAPI
jgi:hypothetical protein